MTPVSPIVAQQSTEHLCGEHLTAADDQYQEALTKSSSFGSNKTSLSAPSLLKRHDVDLPGVHPAERGPGRGTVQLEPLAVQSAGSHQAGGSRLLPLHAAEGETRPATGTVRAGVV